MNLTFSARIEGREIHCEIGSDTALSAPVLCFSMMAKPRVVSGGMLIKTVASYGEVQLPDLVAGGSVKLVLAHEDDRNAPANRAWLPLGAYLRLAGGQSVVLPPLPAGVRAVGDSAAAPDGAITGLPLVPPVEHWAAAGGVVRARGFGGDARAMAELDALSQRLGFGRFHDGSGLPLRASTRAGMPDCAYVIEIAADGVRIEAGSPAGQFAAGVTLMNLVQTTDGQLPLGRIEDAPRFAWRGQHLDCARHFYRVETILRLLDLMALVKLNRFHWHFADDEAFRLQVETAPELWQGTEFRGEGCAVPGLFGAGPRAGGSYSRADVEKVLDRARALHIEVLPEIEFPAHCFGMNAVIGGLTDPVDPCREISIQGYPHNIVNPAIEATWALFEPLSLEIAAMFPMGVLHLGGDELPHHAWKESPAVAALMQRHGLTTQEDMQGHAMARLAGVLADRGIRSAAWEEASRGCQGGIGHDALIFSWTGQGPGLAAARAGHDVVMCPAQHVYFDLAHTADPGDWGASWAGFTALEDVVSWDPVPKGAEDLAARIVGVQGCFWSEFTTEDSQMEPMLAPRILGLAAKAWDRGDRLDGPGLRALAKAYAPLFDRMGWQRHRGA